MQDVTVATRQRLYKLKYAQSKTGTQGAGTKKSKQRTGAGDSQAQEGDKGQAQATTSGMGPEGAAHDASARITQGLVQVCFCAVP